MVCHDHYDVRRTTYDWSTGNDGARYRSTVYFGDRMVYARANDDLDARFGDTQWLALGYTGHQHLDVVRLIHMNGRVQNPVWGRMLSPDPVVGRRSEPPAALNPRRNSSYHGPRARIRILIGGDL